MGQELWILARKSIDLLVATPPEWAAAATADFDAFLVDHANCERKASALALSLVVKYRDRTAIIPALIALAQEELEHFQQVYSIMAARRLQLGNDAPDPYVNQLLATARHGRDERFIDRMLISSLVECRGAERFRLVAEALDDPELKTFYADLHRSETKHGHLFVHLLLQEVDAAAVYPRLKELAEIEADIVRKLELRPALH